MTTPRRITRRRLIVGGVAAAAAGAGAVKLSSGPGERERPRDDLTARVAAAFDDREAARAVGEAYLSERPDEDERTLVALLRRSDPAWARVATPREVRRLARRRARRDCAAGRVVAIEGWYVSQTEARLCALATFASP